MKKINQSFKNNYDYLSYIYSSQLSKSVIINNDHLKCVYFYLKNKTHINDNLLQKKVSIHLADDAAVTPLAGNTTPTIKAGDGAPTSQAGDKEK